MTLLMPLLLATLLSGTPVPEAAAPDASAAVAPVPIVMELQCAP